ARWLTLGKTAEGLKQALPFLRYRNLLPLKRSSTAVPLLCKILGFLFGDGSIHFETDSGKGITNFFGDAADLADIRADVETLGFQPSQVYSRERTHAIQTQ